MAHLYAVPQVESAYARKNWNGTYEEYHHALEVSTTVYVGNLSFYTREEQIWELFSRVGEVKRIVMGLNKFEFTPCGFCFVEYYTNDSAADCVNYVSGTKLDDRVIRADWDTGFVEGRQFGRGTTGGQVRDEFRDYFDPERGDRPRPGIGGPPPSGPPMLHSPHRGGNNPHRGGNNPHHGGYPHPGAFNPSHSLEPHVPGPSPNRHHKGASPHQPHRYDERDRRRDHPESRDYHGRNDYNRNNSRDHRDHRDSRGGNDYRSDRYKRRREGDDDDDGRYPPVPMVDEFGRDIPAPKRPKLEESR